MTRKWSMFLSAAVLLLTGVVFGWAGNSYWTHQMRKAGGHLALAEANQAATKGDFDLAIWYATQAYVLHPDLPIARDMAKELAAKRSARAAICPQK